MRSGLALLVVVVAALLAVTAAKLRPRPSPPADPAREAIAECGASRGQAERDCYARLLHGQVRQGGAGAALRLLGRLAALDSGVRRDGHMHAHMIGIAALRSTAEVGRVFASCTPAFESGCYHGVIQSYFLAARREGRAIDAATVDAVCAAQRGPRGNAWLLFQCTHGLGHGFTMFHGHDLPRALTGCDLMPRPPERENCYGGAFMENIVNVIEPHHMAANAGAPGGGHGGHGHQPRPARGAPAGLPWRALDPNDLHYPCSVMAEKYLAGCYAIQTAAMLYFTRDDVGRTARECARVPARVRSICFVSLGRGVSTIARGDHGAAVRLCSLAEAAFQPDCNVGVAQSVINMNADVVPGVAYCRAVTSGPSKETCYSIVGRAAMLLADGAARREAACRRAEAGFVATCLGQGKEGGWGEGNSATVSGRRPAG